MFQKKSLEHKKFQNIQNSILTFSSEGVWPVISGLLFDCAFFFAGLPPLSVVPPKPDHPTHWFEAISVGAVCGKRISKAVLWLFSATKGWDGQDQVEGYQSRPSGKQRHFKWSPTWSPICTSHADIVCSACAIYGGCDGGVDSPKPGVKNGD